MVTIDAHVERATTPNQPTRKGSNALPCAERGPWEHVETISPYHFASFTDLRASLHNLERGLISSNSKPWDS